MAQAKVKFTTFEEYLFYSNEPIGMELLSSRPSDNRFDAVSVEMGRLVETS
jgi:hypothetical protein